MKRLIKRISALALSAAVFLTPAGAITIDGESETWFDGVWALIEMFGLKAENDPYVLQNYINSYLEKNPDKLYEVMNDILAQLDTHSMYMSAEEYSEGFSTLEGFVGIGVGLRTEDNGNTVVTEVMRHSSAEEAGIQIGDVFLEVNGEDVSKKGSAEIAELLRGEEGARVTIKFLRKGQEVMVECTRRQVNQTYVSNKTLADGVEYIKVSAIGSENDGEAFGEIWEDLDDKNTRAVILDLRGNGGGVINVALGMIDKMTRQEGAYYAGVRWREDQGGLEQHISTGGALPLNKIVVLVDGGTASAAELIAGSLKETGTATLVGEKTYGKGQGQYHLNLVNGDKLVITTLELELPETGCYEGKGITPDMVITNRKVMMDASSLRAMDTSETLRFGDRSENVYAMRERLQLLGFIESAAESFDGDTVDAVSDFRAQYGMEPGLYASPELLTKLDEAIANLDGKTYSVDEQLDIALGLCRIAAQEPQQYVSNPDGTWKAVAS